MNSYMEGKWSLALAEMFRFYDELAVALCQEQVPAASE